MSIAYKKRRKGSEHPYREKLRTPRSKRMKALRRLWLDNARGYPLSHSIAQIQVNGDN